MAKTDLYEAPDYYLLDELLSDEHKLIRGSVREWVKKEVSPIIEDYAQRAEFPKHLLKGLGEIGAFGPTIPVQYGGAGLDYTAYGIIMQEIERGDSGIRSTASVQGSLVMYPIYAYGSEEQKHKYLPKLATGELMGCFGLTEPDTAQTPAAWLPISKTPAITIFLTEPRCGSQMPHLLILQWFGPRMRKERSAD